MASPFVKRYLVALNRHKWVGLAGFTVVLGLSSVAALRPPPPQNYTAEGLLAYVIPPVTFSQTSTALQQQGQALTKEMLLSDYVIQSTAKGLADQQIQADPEAVRRNTSIDINPAKQESRSQVSTSVQVQVSYQSPNDKVAQAATKLLMDAIVEQSRLFNSQQLEVIVKNLNELLPKVTGELRQAEQNLERYTREQGPAIQSAEDGALVGAITGGQEQQRQLRLALTGIEAQIQSLQARLGLSPDEAYASSALSADPIIGNLRAQIYQTESQTAILSQTLRPDHPTMRELQNQQRAYEQLLQARVTEVMGGNQISAPLRGSDEIRQASSLDPARQQLADLLVNLETQRETLRQQIAELSVAEKQFRREYSSIPNKQLEQSRLEQQVSLKRAFYDQLQSRLADVTLAKNEVVGSLVVTKVPDVKLTNASTQNNLVILVVGGFVGLLVGGGLVLLLDSLDATFHTFPDLQTALRQQEVPVLGLLPLMPLQDGEDIPVVAEVSSPYIEPYERLRGNLRRAASKALKILLITSTLGGEGKTVTAYNLAIASARAGKRTLLVEADLRSPSQAKALKITPDPDSLIEPLRYYGHLSDCIRLVPEIENLYILPNPGIQKQAAAILESSEMRRLLEDVRGRFDLVILDTPSLTRYSDALILEPYTDGMVLITRPGYTEEGLLNEAIEQFNESDDLQFLGAIINGADIPIQSPGLPEDADTPFILEDLESQQDIERQDEKQQELEKVSIGSRDI